MCYCYGCDLYSCSRLYDISYATIRYSNLDIKNGVGNQYLYSITAFINKPNIGILYFSD